MTDAPRTLRELAVELIEWDTTSKKVVNGRTLMDSEKQLEKIVAGFRAALAATPPQSTPISDDFWSDDRVVSFVQWLAQRDRQE